jgi:hypothetical protein
MYQGSLAIDHLFHISMKLNTPGAAGAPVQSGSQGQQGPPGPGPQPHPGQPQRTGNNPTQSEFETMKPGPNPQNPNEGADPGALGEQLWQGLGNTKTLRQVPGAVQRSDRMEKPLQPPPATYSPGQQQNTQQQARAQPAQNPGRQLEQESPMPPPSMQQMQNNMGHPGAGGGAGGGLMDRSQDRQGGPGSSSQGADPGLGQKRSNSLNDAFSEPDKPAVDMAKYGGGKKGVNDDQLEQFQALRKKQDELQKPKR